MVLWEITLGTAYFLGLKRTYKLALKIERCLVSAKHPKTRDFIYRRTRAIFDMAVRVHRNVQQRDLEVGRNVGNWILRWLDRMKPTAEIRGSLPTKPPSGSGTTKHLSSSSRTASGPSQRSNHTNAARKSDGRLFATSVNLRSKFPTWSMMMRPLNSVHANMQYRQLSICGPASISGPPSNGRKGFGGGVIREDIMQWMLRN